MTLESLRFEIIKLALEHKTEPSNILVMIGRNLIEFYLYNEETNTVEWIKTKPLKNE